MTTRLDTIESSPFGRDRHCQIAVRGPCQPLLGQAALQGAKNVTMPVLTAAALSHGKAVVANVPNIEDIRSLLAIFTHLGLDTRQCADTIVLESRPPSRSVIPEKLSARLRGSIYTLAIPAIHFGRGQIGAIGGDLIVGRSLEPHARAFAGFGMSLDRRGIGWELSGGPPRPGEFSLQDRPAGVSASALAVLLAAALDGVSIMHEVSLEPEVLSLLECVKAFGAQVFVDDTTVIIRGPMDSKEAFYKVPFDDVYGGTLVAAAAITAGEISLPYDLGDRMTSILQVFSSLGLCVRYTDDHIAVSGSLRNGITLESGAYPGFPADLLPPMTALLSQAPGASTVIDTVYPSRFDHIDGLRTLGARIVRQNNQLMIQGGSRLIGQCVSAHGIREIAALVVAGLAAQGRTIIAKARPLFRGYADLPRDLDQLGADISTEWTSSSNG